MDFSSPYLTEQIIAYIGNKRKLLPLIFRAIESTGLEIKSGLKFFDAFSGSGVVSRMAKSLNFEVFANDWEYYANVLSKGYVETNESDLKSLFGSIEEFSSLLGKINSLKNPTSDFQYIAKFYAPKEFDSGLVDFRTERLFYTRQNALSIDKIRNYIEENFSGKDEKSQKIRNILLANLIYEAATHTNTSGVFKAFHKGFGGHGRDALKRIMAGIELHEPVLIDSEQPVHVFRKDANALARELKEIDIAYLDPPYNQHQYGSNYHLLNTIALWDHIPAPLELNAKGTLKEKAAIRHDWVNTRSDYCYRNSAREKFADLIENLDARHILVSYSTDGIIPFDEMRKICSGRGRLSIVTNEYSTYRGGKRSATRQNTNIEFILCIDTSKKSDPESDRKIDEILMRRKLILLFRQKFSERLILKAVGEFAKGGNSVLEGVAIREMTEQKSSSQKPRTRKNAQKSIFFSANGREIEVRTKNFFDLDAPENALELALEELREIHDFLEKCVLKSKEEELAELAFRAENSGCPLNLARKIPATLKNFAHKKNREIFFEQLGKIEKIRKKNPELYKKIEENLEKVRELAQMRFTS